MAGTVRPGVHRAWFDDQCEVCQAGVAWLRLLDRRGRVECLPIEAQALRASVPPLELEACLRELHVVTPDGAVRRGWDAVACLARLFPVTWLLGALGALPPFSWLLRALYRFVARNRYQLSKCRGGRCRVAVRRDAASRLGAFWSCRAFGLFLRAPLLAGAFVRDAWTRVATAVRTWRRRVDLLDGQLRVCFLGGFPCDLLPLFFDERFTMLVYGGVAVDPGSTRMRASVRRHLRRLPVESIRAVVATHHHEEHSGNLGWLARELGVPLYVAPATARILTAGFRVPFTRRVVIGPPDRLEPGFIELGARLPIQGGELEVFPAPGHCADQIVLYDRARKVLLAGDSFMGSYFSAPNPEVDSRRWIESLERLLALDIAVLVEGHGHVHTLRRDVPEVPGVVVRADPMAELRAKLAMLRWVRDQIESGLLDGLPLEAVQATCFPWRRRWSWERFGNDSLAALLTGGHFSRRELVRSFFRQPGSTAALPMVHELRAVARTPAAP